jgi:hypothetical protein
LVGVSSIAAVLIAAVLVAAAPVAAIAATPEPAAVPGISGPRRQRAGQTEDRGGERASRGRRCHEETLCVVFPTIASALNS